MDMTRMTSILGWAQTPFGNLPDRSVMSLAAEAAAEALEHADMGLDDVDAGWLSLAYPGLTYLEGEVGSFLGEALGRPELPVTRVTNLCAGGLDAVRNACYAVRAGAVRVALVVGVEKMRDVPPKGSVVQRYREDTHPVLAKGRTAPGMFALRAKHYRHVFGSDPDVFREIAVKNRENGAKNPLAQLRVPLSLEEVLDGPIAADPLHVAECCPTSDGAAAVVIAAEGVGRSLVSIRSIALGSSRDFYRCQFASSNDYLGFEATRRAAAAAYAEADIHPGQIDVVECHDCFSVTEILDMEDLGLCQPGEGWKMVREGQTRVGASTPVNPSGGLIAGGHPVGATGVRMVADISRQLTGTAPNGLQVRGARLGLAHALGGPGNVAAVGVLQAVE